MLYLWNHRRDSPLDTHAHITHTQPLLLRCIAAPAKASTSEQQCHHCRHCATPPAPPSRPQCRSCATKPSLRRRHADLCAAATPQHCRLVELRISEGCWVFHGTTTQLFFSFSIQQSTEQF